MSAPTGFVHEAALYGGEAGLLALVVPFVEAGLAADEPVVIALGAAHAEMVRDALSGTPNIEFLPGGYHRPAARVAALLDMFRARADASPGRLRLVGEFAGESLAAAAWSPWAHYEAAVNHLYAPFNATALCVFDTTTTPAGVLADIEATHPHVVTAHGRRSNDRYRAPAEFLATRAVAPDPVESSPPVFDLDGPDPATARRAVRHAAAVCAIGDDDIEHLVLGVSELVANAHLHGRPPIRVRIWATGDRVVAMVSDGGPGPSQPYAGLVRLDTHGGGLGLWITHQLCGHVDHISGRHGFAARVATGPPHS